MGASTDIDIDLPDRAKALAGFWHVPAAMSQRGARSSHRSGVYFQDMPVDPRDGLAAFDYKQAVDRGYFKIDLLVNHLYEGVRDEAHLDALLALEPLWEMLDEEAVVERLSHVSSHFSVLQAIRPRSVQDLAICLALVRPGKRHLIGQNRSKIDAEIWEPTADYFYKKSHATAYALSIAVQMNLLLEVEHSL